MNKIAADWGIPSEIKPVIYKPERIPNQIRLLNPYIHNEFIPSHLYYNSSMPHAYVSCLSRKPEHQLQRVINKDANVSEWLLQNKKLGAYYPRIIEIIDSIIKCERSITSFSLEIKKEDLVEETLKIYVLFSKNVNYDQMMSLWKQISSKSVGILNELADNDDEFENLLEKTTITLKRI
jgi:hypothetical protein